jgi:oxalate decarboxylase/phosphoglucose isomerase-like protein (cupin superfamily)
VSAGRTAVFLPRHRDDVGDQPYKFGVWASRHMRVTSWQLECGQRIVAHAYAAADDLMVVLAGDGHVLVYEDAEPDSRSVYTPLPDAVVVPPEHRAGDECCKLPVSAGHVVVVSAGMFHGLVNTGALPMLVVVVTGPETAASRYVVR